MTTLFPLSVFPSYSETFIEAEIANLRESGINCVVLCTSPKQKESNHNGLVVLANTWNPTKLIKANLLQLFRWKSILTNTQALSFLIRCVLLKPSNIFKIIYLAWSYDYLNRRLSVIKPDHCSMNFLYRSTIAGYLLCKNNNIPFGIRLHTNRSYIPHKLLGNVLNDAKSISAVTNDAKDYFQSFTNNAIVVERQFLKRDNLNITKEPASSNQYQLIAIGRLIPKKGFIHLVRAIHLIRQKSNPDVRLDIYGDGPEEELLRNEINKLNLTTNISLKGKVDHETLMKTLSGSDLLVVPSVELKEDVDGLPTVIPEAMILRTPVLASNVAGITELVKHENTGFIIEYVSPEAIAASVVDIIKGSSNLSEVVDNAYSLVKKEYQFD